MASANITHSSSAPSERALLLKRRARFMRHHPTASEYRLWLVLSGSKLGVPFRRQVVIGDFIADFCCKKLKLIVEVDGGYHEHRVRLDAARVRKLQRAGYAVVVVSHEAVMARLESVAKCVWAAVEARR